MLVKMAEVLVKIAVMMMAPGGVPAPPEARGREPPPSSSSLTFSLDGRRVSPLVHGLHGVGGARAPPRLDMSLCLSLFLRSQILPCHVFIFPEIRKTICFRILAFLRRKKGNNRLTGCPRGSGARPLPRGFLEHRLVLILLPKNHKYSKNILRPFLSRLDSV